MIVYEESSNIKSYVNFNKNNNNEVKTGIIRGIGFLRSQNCTFELQPNVTSNLFHEISFSFSFISSYFIYIILTL